MAQNLILWLIIAAVLVTVMNNFSSPSESNKLNYSEFIQQVQEGEVKRVTVDGYIISGVRTDGSSFETCLLYTSPSPRDGLLSRMPSSA